MPYTTDGQGASYGFEELNTGANAVHTMLFIGGDFNGSVAPVLSAQQYIGTGAPATGLAFVVNNPGYFVNLTKFNQVGPADLGGRGAALTSTYLRAAGIFDLAGWDTAVGVQSWSGTSTAIDFVDIADPTSGVVSLVPQSALTETKAWAIDGQMQNTLANNMPLGIYVTYASAPAASVAGISNAYNGGADTRSSFNIAAELGVIPEKATIGFGIRRGKSGDTTITGSNASDNAILLEAQLQAGAEHVAEPGLHQTKRRLLGCKQYGRNSAARKPSSTWRRYSDFRVPVLWPKDRLLQNDRGA